MKQNTVNAMWHHYSDNVLPKSAESIQRIECKRAFFAGATLMMELMASASELDEESGPQRLSSLADELQGFCTAVELGAA